MEGVPFFPESSSDDDPEDSIEKKDKKDSKDKKLSVFEKQEPTASEKTKNKPESKKPDKEVPLEKLAEDEKQLVTQKYVEARNVDVKQELGDVELNSVDEIAVLANAAFLENIQDRINSDEPVSEELLDDIVDETIHELGIENIVELSEFDIEADDDEELDDDTSVPIVPTIVSNTAKTTSTPTPALAVPPLRPPLPPIVTPTPPVPPIGSGSGPVYPHSSGTIGSILPRSTRPEIITVPDKRRERANLIVGGLLGYMLGRRRGRIKTENKLIPVQEKLQKEVSNLQNQITLREEKIRKIAYEQAIAQPMLQEKIVESVKSKAETKLPKSIRPEKLGKFAVFAERPVFKTPESLKSASQMSVSELLSVASNIKVEQMSVKSLYETGRMNEHVLRRVIESYLKGERYEVIVRENLLSPETISESNRIEKVSKNSNNSRESIERIINDPGTAPSFMFQPHNPTNAQTKPKHSIIKNEKTKQISVLSIFLVVTSIILIILLISR